MRLDVYIAVKGYVESRNKAKNLIEKGSVLVNGEVVDKPSFSVKDEDRIEITEQLKYVSRGGLKLEKALEEFKIDLTDKVCIDVGSSTGGFTDCMLQHRARAVFAVDVGNNQMHPILRQDIRVFLFEDTDIRDFSTAERFEFASIDVSFISLKLVLKPVKFLLKPGADVIALIKPQFEVGRGGTVRGIVKNEAKIKKVIKDIENFSAHIGFKCKELTESPIRGKEGNREFLIWLKNE